MKFAIALADIFDLNHFLYSLERLIREAQLQKVPYMLVIGDREQEADAVAVRHRKHGDMGAKPVAQFIEEACKLVQSKNVTE